MTDPKVDVIILNWNNASDTKKCIISLLQQDYKNVDIIVVDNGSTDGSDETLQRHFKDISNIEFILLKENTGFAEGNNTGIRKALEHDADYIFLLNNDALVTPKCIATLVEVGGSDDRIGIIGAVNLYSHDPSRIWYSGGIISWGKSGFIDETSETLYDPNDRRVREVDDVAGSSMLVKKEVIKKTGLMWAPYFLCYEESELCLRTKKSGFRVVAAMEAVVYHKVHASMDNPTIYYYMHRNYPIFMLRNCPPLKMPGAIISYLVKIPVRYLKLILAGDSKLAAILWRAQVDFFRRRYSQKHL
jgi:GT2 family glycosyltransferase